MGYLRQPDCHIRNQIPCGSKIPISLSVPPYRCLSTYKNLILGFLSTVVFQQMDPPELYLQFKGYEDLISLTT